MKRSKTGKVIFEEVPSAHVGDKLLRRVRRSPGFLKVIYRKIARFAMGLFHRELF
ncbi:MAG: hypothetical protein JW856_04040 [Dehalococcoidales bacterium]|nr:hypothetical protein [Dehalococcoidales bacterium]